MTRVVLCCDGLDPAYLAATDTPGWDAIADDGASGTCNAVVPTLTNVNNVSIVTTSHPDTHGITGNTYYDPAKGERVYMEDPSYLRCDTRIQTLTNDGARVGVLVAKQKLERMVGGGSTTAASAESPPAWLEDAVGPAPDIYSGEASRWLLDAAVHLLDNHELDWLYVSTTDVIPHKHPPGDPAAAEWVAGLDDGIARLHARASGVVATADHGMRQKTLAVDVERLLEQDDIPATVIRLIRDEHVYHHQNLGGAAYVYLSDPTTHDDARRLLRHTTGVDTVLTTDEAAERFRLPPDRIGDLMLLGTPESVFGPLDNQTHADVDLRSHGSHHEQQIPYATTTGATLEHNTDAFAALEESS